MNASSLEALQTFFTRAPAARKATRPLARTARVSLSLAEGPAHFTMDDGEPAIRAGPGEDPDFTLTLPPAAVGRLTATETLGVGALGVEFFKLVLDRDPALRVRMKVNAPTARLLGHGYLGVLALGGLEVGWWLLRNGIKDPRAVIERLRGAR